MTSSAVLSQIPVQVQPEPVDVRFTGPSLISVDQTYVCFDIEQPVDARQELVVSRSADAPKGSIVAFRFRTNAPTRYIVSPNAGVLTDNKQSQTVMIELVGNRYNPYHRLILQAIQVQDEAEIKHVWKSNRLKKDMQAIPLDLSTTLIYIDKTHTLNSETSKDSVSITSIMEQSSRVGEDRVKELTDICAMIKCDMEYCQENAEQARQVKDVLIKHLDQRKQWAANLQDKLKNKEEKYIKLNRKVESLEMTLKHLQVPKQNDPNNCRLM